MITRADDYPIHQTAAPIATVATDDRNFYDRYFFNGYARDGSVFFAAALGQYPNRNVVDAAFNVVYRDRQSVVRASCRATHERMQTSVGPVSVTVLEPLRQLRVVVEPNPWEISAELTFTVRVPPIEEPRFQRALSDRVMMDYTRLTQHVDVRGTLHIGGETLVITPDRFWGSRDRSWGIRPVGERDPEAFAGPLQFFWLWSPVNFENFCTHFDVNEEADGTRWHQAGMVVPLGGRIEPCTSVDYRIEYRTGTRHAKRAEITLRRPEKPEVLVALTPLYNFYMVGLGYGHPQWGHGMRVGDYVAGGESWRLSEVDPAVPLHLHVQAVCEATCNGHKGIGVLEQLILGPHHPSGFTELFDTAR